MALDETTNSLPGSSLNPGAWKRGPFLLLDRNDVFIYEVYIVSFFSTDFIYMMHSAVRNKRKRKDRERKAALVPCYCHLCKGTLCSAKKVRRHMCIFTNDSIDLDTQSLADHDLPSVDPESSDQLSDSSSSLSSSQQFPVDVDSAQSSQLRDLEGEPEIESVQCELSDQENFVSDSDRDSSDFSEDYLERGSTASFSDESLVVSDHKGMDISASSESSHEGSMVESDHGSTDDELDGPSTLPLFEGSSKTVLEVLAGYFCWFSSHPSISKSALSSLLSHEHFNVLPSGNNLPSTYEQAYNFIKPELLPTVCYHACPNDCVLFRATERYDYSKLKNCPKCKKERFAANGQPLRRFIYYPVGPRWRRLYECEATSELLQSHAVRPNQCGVMSDVYDAPCWKVAYAKDGYFQGDPHGLSVQLSTDGVNPFSANKISYSMWPIMLTVLNWPKTCRNHFENIMLVGVIPANGKEEPKSVDPYIEVLVDELMQLSGTTFYDAYKEEKFTFRVRLHNYVLDYPGLNKVFCSTGAGALQGCMWCEILGKFWKKKMYLMHAVEDKKIQSKIVFKGTSV